MTTLEALLLRFTDFFPVLIRVASFLMSLPFLGRGVPTLAKIGLAATVTFLIAPVIPVPALPQEMGGFFLIIVEEVLVGLAIGIVVTTLIMAVYLAGQLIDVPIGFGMVNVMDPQTGGDVPIIAQFQFVLAILVFFLIDGHHGLFRSLVQSFHVVPVGSARLTGDVAAIALETVGAMFLIGVRLALPIVGALFLTDIALGIVARAVPQINVFFVGFPLKIGLGIVLLVFVLPAFVAFVIEVYGASGELNRLLSAIVRALAESP